LDHDHCVSGGEFEFIFVGNFNPCRADIAQSVWSVIRFGSIWSKTESLMVDAVFFEEVDAVSVFAIPGKAHFTVPKMVI